MRPPPLVLGIDFGTTYFKAGLFKPDGTLVGLGRAAVAPTQGAQGQCELGVPAFWQCVRQAVQQAIAHAQADIGSIAGLSYSSQANSFLLLDSSDRPLTDLLLWPDSRASAEPIAKFGAAPEFVRHTGFSGLGSQFSPAKWRWFQTEQPKLWSRCAKVALLPDYFTYVLTGRFACDAATAAFTGALDLSSRTWWPAALEHYGVARAQLADVLPAGTIVGSTNSAAAELLGLPAGIPVAVGTLDHHAAGLGSGIGRWAEASISTGTVLAAMLITRDFTPHDGCFHGPHVADGTFFRLVFNPDGAGQLERYRIAHAPHLPIEQLLAEAGGTLTDRSSTAHGEAVRAILERICHTHRALLELLASHTRVDCVAATGGGSRSPLWLQIQANILGVPVVAPTSEERACLGAALFAAQAAGWHGTVQSAAEAMVSRGRTYEPQPYSV